MELPGRKAACVAEFRGRHILAAVGLGKYLLADWNGTFDWGIDDLLGFLVESDVDQVEVVPAVDRSDDGDVVLVEVDDLMFVTLYNYINSACRQFLNHVGDGAFGAGILGCCVLPNAEV